MPLLEQVLSSTSGKEVPGAFRDATGKEIVIFCIIDILEDYGLDRKAQHFATDVVASLRGIRNESSIMPPLQYRKRQARLFEELVMGKSCDISQDVKSSS